MNHDPNGAIVFTGAPCCIFDGPAIPEAIREWPRENLRDYGGACRNPDGTVRHFLHTWDEGKRMLQRCTRCGALFLFQKSEYHAYKDDYYSDWFQVDNEATAELINATLDGFAIEREYRAPAVFVTNGTVSFRNVRRIADGVHGDLGQ